MNSYLLRMQDDLRSRTLVLRDRRAARAMRDPFRRHLVLWLVGRQASLAELAALAGKPISTMFSLVRNLEKLGLLKVAATVARRGRPIRKYTAAAPAFLAPAALDEEPRNSALERELRTSLELWGPQLTGTVYSTSGSGGMRITPIHEDAEPHAQTADKWRIVALSAEQLRQLVDQIAHMLDQAEANQSGTRKYLIRFAAAPTEADEFFAG